MGWIKRLFFGPPIETEIWAFEPQPDITAAELAVILHDLGIPREVTAARSPSVSARSYGRHFRFVRKDKL